MNLNVLKSALGTVGHDVLFGAKTHLVDAFTNNFSPTRAFNQNPII
jgi:hypothetical protein